MFCDRFDKGFSIVEMIIVLAVAGIIAAIAIPNLLSARRSANEAAAVASIRTISTAEETYQLSFGNGDFGGFAQLAGTGLIDSALGSGNKHGYNFSLTHVTKASNNGVAIYDATGVPQVFGNTPFGTGTKNFYINETGLIGQSFVDGVPPSAASNVDRQIINGFPL